MADVNEFETFADEASKALMKMGITAAEMEEMMQQLARAYQWSGGNAAFSQSWSNKDIEPTPIYIADNRYL